MGAASACAHLGGGTASDPLPTISTGDRVRIWHRSPCCANPLIGLEDSVTSDAVWVKSESDAVRLAVPAASITRIDKWAPVRHSLPRFAAVGLVGGASFGLLLDTFFKALTPHTGDWRGFRTRFVVGGAALGLISSIIVAGIETANWEAADIHTGHGTP